MAAKPNIVMMLGVTTIGALVLASILRDEPVVEETAVLAPAAPTTTRRNDDWPVVDVVPAAESIAAGSAVAVRFSEGVSVQVRVRQRPRVEVPFPTHLASAYSFLKAKAEAGDGESAYVLHNAISACKQSGHRTREDLESAIEILYQTRRLAPPGDQQPSEISLDQDLAPYERGLRDTFAMCEDLPDEVLGEADAWLITAAEAGHVDSMYTLGIALDNTIEGRQFLEDAWLAGEIEAAGWLGKYYEQSRDVQPDPSRAYAYTYIYTALTEQQFQRYGTERPMARWWLESNIESLERKRRLLRPPDLADATELAERLLKSNEACCFLSPIIG